MIYATIIELMDYLEIQEAPQHAEKLLQKASKIIDNITLGRIDPNNQSHMTAAKNATLSQVEHFLEVDPSLMNFDNIQSFSVGKFSMNFGQGGVSQLAPMARHYLSAEGLLYRGVKS